MENFKSFDTLIEDYKKLSQEINSSSVMSNEELSEKQKERSLIFNNAFYSILSGKTQTFKFQSLFELLIKDDNKFDIYKAWDKIYFSGIIEREFIFYSDYIKELLPPMFLYIIDQPNLAIGAAQIFRDAYADKYLFIVEDSFSFLLESALRTALSLEDTNSKETKEELRIFEFLILDIAQEVSKHMNTSLLIPLFFAYSLKEDEEVSKRSMSILESFEWPLDEDIHVQKRIENTLDELEKKDLLSGLDEKSSKLRELVKKFRGKINKEKTSNLDSKTGRSVVSTLVSTLKLSKKR